MEMSLLEAIRRVNLPEWPRSVENWSEDQKANCWEFALDGIKIPIFEKRNHYSSNDGVVEGIFDFMKEIGLSPRFLSFPEERGDSEFCLLIYCYEYYRENLRTEEYGWYSEVHLARMDPGENDVQEKPSWIDPVRRISLEKVNEIIAADAGRNYSGPIYIGFRKP